MVRAMKNNAQVTVDTIDSTNAPLMIRIRSHRSQIGEKFFNENSKQEMKKLKCAVVMKLNP
jgi:hypothetical protein